MDTHGGNGPAISLFSW